MLGRYWTQIGRKLFVRTFSLLPPQTLDPNWDSTPFIPPIVTSVRSTRRRRPRKRHHREAKGRLRPHDADAGQALQVGGERIRDLVVDLLRAMARSVGEDDHLVVGEIRDHRVDWCGAQRPPAPTSQAEVQARTR